MRIDLLVNAVAGTAIKFDPLVFPEGHKKFRKNGQFLR